MKREDLSCLLRRNGKRMEGEGENMPARSHGASWNAIDAWCTKEVEGNEVKGTLNCLVRQNGRRKRVKRGSPYLISEPLPAQGQERRAAEAAQRQKEKVVKAVLGQERQAQRQEAQAAPTYHIRGTLPL